MDNRQVDRGPRVEDGRIPPRPVDRGPELGHLGQRTVEHQKVVYSKVSVSLWHPVSSLKSIWDYVTSSEDTFVCRRMHDALASAKNGAGKDKVFAEVVELWENASADSKKRIQLIKPLLTMSLDSRIDASTRAEILKLLCETGDINVWKDGQFLRAAKKIINDGNLSEQDLKELFDKVLGSAQKLENSRAAHRLLARMLLDCPAEKRPTSLALHLAEKLATYASGDYSEEKNLNEGKISSHRKIDSERFERLCEGLASKSSIHGDEFKDSLTRMAEAIGKAKVNQSEALRHGFLAIAGSPAIDFSTRLEVVDQCLGWLKKDQSASFSKHAFPVFSSLLKGAVKENAESQAQLEELLVKYMATLDDPQLMNSFGRLLSSLSDESRKLFNHALARNPELLLSKRLDPCLKALTKTDLEALSKNTDASLQARMYFFGKYLERLGDAVTPYRLEGGPLNACKIALNDHKTPSDKRIDALNALIDYKDLLSHKTGLNMPPLREDVLSNYLLREIGKQPQDKNLSNTLFRSLPYASEDARGSIVDALKLRMSVDEILNHLSDDKDRSYVLGRMLDQKAITPAGLLLRSRAIKNGAVRTALIMEKVIPSLEKQATPEDIFAVVSMLLDTKSSRVPDVLWDLLEKKVASNPDCRVGLRLEAMMLRSGGKARYQEEDLKPYKDQYQAILHNPNPSISQICDFYSVAATLTARSVGGLWITSSESLRDALREKEGLARLQLLIEHGIVLEPNKEINVNEAQSIHESVKALMEDPELSREQKFLLAFRPLETLVKGGSLDYHIDLLSYYLDLANGFYSDLAEIPLRSLSRLEGIRNGLERATEKLGLEKNDFRCDVLRELRKMGSYSGWTNRLFPVVHEPPIIHFEAEDVDPIQVKWNSAYIANPLPKPDVPDVSYEDFKDWAKDYEEEIKASKEAQAQMRLMTGADGLEHFMLDAKRDRFEVFLKDDRVTGSFVDPTALDLRRVVARAKTLSGVPEKGEVISPRALLFQQLLVNCQTCSTGFKDGVGSTAREIRNDTHQAVAKDENAMREARKRDAFANAYLEESVSRRKRLLDGESALTRELAGLSKNDRVSQPVHQSWAMDALLGKRIGVHCAGDLFKIDDYMSCVYTSLINYSPQKAIEAFYRHYDVKNEVIYFKELWNSKIAEDRALGEEKQKIKVLISEQSRLSAKKQLYLEQGEDRDPAHIWSDEMQQRLDELNAMKLQELAAELEAKQPHGIEAQIASLLSGGGLPNAYDYDDDYMPTNLNDYGVVKLMIAIGALEEVK